MGNTNDQHDEFIVADFVQDALIAGTKPPQPSEITLQGRSEMRSLPQPVDGRGLSAFDPGLATRFSSLAAVSLIRIEKFTPNLVPLQHRIAGIAEPVDGD